MLDWKLIGDTTYHKEYEWGYSCGILEVLKVISRIWYMIIQKRRDCLSPRNLFLIPMSLDGLDFLFFLADSAELKHEDPTDNDEDS